MIAVLSFENLCEMVSRRVREMWSDDGDEFDVVCLCQLSFLSYGYYPGPTTGQTHETASGWDW